MSFIVAEWHLNLCRLLSVLITYYYNSITCLTSSSKTIKQLQQSRQTVFHRLGKKRKNSHEPSASCWGSWSLALVTGSTGLSQPFLLQPLNVEVQSVEITQQEDTNRAIRTAQSTTPDWCDSPLCSQSKGTVTRTDTENRAIATNIL